MSFSFVKANFLLEQLIKHFEFKIFKNKIIRSFGKLLEIGQKIFFEKTTANIAITDSTFLSIKIGT